MDRMLLRMFQEQVLLQCKFMLLSAHELNAALVTPDTTRTFYAIQGLLSAAASVSKALWGEGGRRADERQPLRDSIGVSDNSPLREVTMRNNFEHFDSRLSEWWEKSERHNYLDLSIMARSMVSGLDDQDMFRTFDPMTTDLVFWSQSFNIQALVQEVVKILPKLEQEARKPHWEQPEEESGLTPTPPPPPPAPPSP